MWTKLMCRLWAIKHEKAYRTKAIKNGLIFLSALVILCEVFSIYFYGGLSVFGILAIIVFGTLLAYVILTKINERRGNNAQDD